MHCFKTERILIAILVLLITSCINNADKKFDILFSIEEQKEIEAIKLLEISPQPLTQNSDEYKLVASCLNSLLQYHKNRPRWIKNINIKIIPTEIFCTSIPPNTILISQRILQVDDPYGAKGDKDIIIAILAHELCHLWWNHTKEKSTRTVDYNFATVERLIQHLEDFFPTVLPKKIYTSGQNFSISPSDINWYLESSADLFALLTLTGMRRNPSSYLAYNEKISHLILNGKIKTLQNEGQVERLRSFFDVNFLTNDIRIASLYLIYYNKDGIYEQRIENIEELQHVAEEIKKDPSKGSIAMHALNYWICAIRQRPSWSSFLGKDSFYDISITFNRKLLKKDRDEVLKMSTYYIPVEINKIPSFLLEVFNLD